MNTQQHPILGILCTVRSPATRHAIRIVLEQIKSRAPKDFARIAALVREFAPIPSSNDGTLGQWKAGKKNWEFNSQGKVELLEEPGVVVLVEHLDYPVATVAHELGHVCTREDDEFKWRGIDTEWESELTADRYAYKGGFGREIAKSRKSRAWGHHGVPPGKMFSREIDGQLFHYRVTRNFYLRFVHKERKEC